MVSEPERPSGVPGPEPRPAARREAIANRIRDFMVERFPEARARPPHVDEPLLDGGILHSLGILELVEFVEAEYEIVFADDEVTAEVFATLGSLADFVRRKRNGEARCPG